MITRNQILFFILQIILSFVTLLGEIPTGVIVDKIGYKKSLVLSQCLLTVARAMFLVADTMSWFVVEAVLEGVAFCFQSGTDSAYLYSVSGDENYAKERAESTNWGTVFAVLLPQGNIKKQKSETKNKHSYKFEFSKENLSLMLISGALSLGWLEINYFYVDKFVSTGISVEWMSLIILGYSLVQMVLPWMIKFFGKWKKYFVFEALMVSAVMLLLLFTDKKWVFIPVMLIFPLLLDLAGVYVSKYTNVQIDAQQQEENRATILSVMNMGSDVLEIVFLFLSVVICEGTGNVTFLIAGMILLLLGIVTRKYVKGER